MRESFDKAPERAGYGFGTFQGVFTPSILTILGVIMYLRFGWALGSVGLGPTLLIITLASGLTFLTGLSLSALATNRKVAGGGAYHIISRSLGAEAGAAVGVPLFFAQALGISFYLAGFAESLVATFPQWIPQLAARLGLSAGAVALADTHAVVIVGLVVLLVLAFTASFSADLALKTQFAVMAAIVVSLAALFLGGPPLTLPDAAEALPAVRSFWPVFAVIFPAATGIEAGIAMSGDLRDPAKALPRGTMAAVLCGYIVYLAMCVFLWLAVADKTQLLHPMIARHVARWGRPVLLGVWAASLSSAMGSLLGAPRTLQALARDRIVPRLFGRGSGPRNDPRLATAMATVIAAGGLLLGNLDLIAPVLSMFFLTSYGLLNISAAAEELAGIPSWRPTFRVKWWISAVAAVGCFAAMFMIHAGATFMAMLLAAAIYFGTKRRKLRARWGDARGALYSFCALQSMRALQRKGVDERTWQPNILTLSGSPASRWYLIELAAAIARDNNFLTVAAIVPEDTSPERVASLSSAVQDYLHTRDTEAFVRVVPAASPFAGAQTLVRAYGYGPIRPNTVLLGETEDPQNFAAFAALVTQTCRQRQNLVIVRESDASTATPTETPTRMDLWWYGSQRNLGLMLALAHLLQRSPTWSRADLILKTLVAPDASLAHERERLEQFVRSSRIRARAEVFVKPPDGDVFDFIRDLSRGADLVFLGMRAPQDGETAEDYCQYYRDLLAHTEGLPPAALALAAEEMDYYAIFEQE